MPHAYLTIQETKNTISAYHSSAGKAQSQTKNERNKGGILSTRFIVTDTNPKTNSLLQPPPKSHRDRGNIFHGAQGRAQIPAACL